MKRLKLYLACFCLLSAGSVCAKETNKDLQNTTVEPIIEQVTLNPILAPSPKCGMKELTDVDYNAYAWRIFSYINSPMYHTQVLRGRNPKPVYSSDFWSEAISWHDSAPNLAPRWATMLPHSALKNAKPPFLHLQPNWQCGDNCLFSKPPTESAEGKVQPVLLDNNGNPIMYEQRYNPAWMYSTINLADYGSKPYTNLFHIGDCRNGNAFSPPSLMLKLGWKKLTKDDEPSRFITMTTNNENYGLVAMHMAAKTYDHWEWIWASFEHTNNFKQAMVKNKTFPSNFKLKDSKCHDRFEPNCVPSLTPYPVKPEVAKVNQLVQKAFKQQKSPLQHYQLLDVQYKDPKNITRRQINSPDLTPQQQELAKAIEECNTSPNKNWNYFVNDAQTALVTLNVGSCQSANAIINPKLFNPVFEPFPAVKPNKNLSCISCHVDANFSPTSDLKEKKFADFSFTLKNYLFNHSTQQENGESHE